MAGQPLLARARPARLYAEPVAMITARAAYSPPWVRTILISPVRSTRDHVVGDQLGTEPLGLVRIWSISSGPTTPSGKPG